MPSVPRTNPYGTFNFVLEFIDGPDEAADALEQLGFTECSGLDGNQLPMEYRDTMIPNGAGDGAFVRKLPGMESYPNVVLRRGITGNPKLWEWRNRVRNGDPWEDVKANIRVSLQNEKHEIVMSWRLQDAWPCKLSGPALNARTNEIAVETLELCCERIELSKD
jgi:phage tail-like protein